MGPERLAVHSRPEDQMVRVGGGLGPAIWMAAKWMGLTGLPSVKAGCSCPFTVEWISAWVHSYNGPGAEMGRENPHSHSAPGMTPPNAVRREEATHESPRKCVISFIGRSHVGKITCCWNSEQCSAGMRRVWRGYNRGFWGLATSCSLILVLVTQACSVCENSLRCILKLCVLFCKYTILG